MTQIRVASMRSGISVTLMLLVLAIAIWRTWASIRGHLEPSQSLPASEMRSDMVNGLLSAPLAVSKLDGAEADFASILESPEAGVRVLACRAQRCVLTSMNTGVRTFMSTAAPVRFLCQVNESGRTPALAVVREREGGLELCFFSQEDFVGGNNPAWRRDLGSQSVKSVALEYRREQPVGVVIGEGRDNGVSCYGLAGQLRWSIPDAIVVHDLGTHPRVPGVLLTVGGAYEIWEIPEPLDQTPPPARRWRPHVLRRRGASSVFARFGDLIPDDRGFGAILTGTTKDGAAVLLRVNEDDQETWRVKLPGAPEGMVTLDGGAMGTVTVLCFSDGSLLFVDASGVLRLRCEGPPGRVLVDGRSPALSALEGGGDRAWIVLRTSTGAHLYSVNLLRLGGR